MVRQHFLEYMLFISSRFMATEAISYLVSQKKKKKEIILVDNIFSLHKTLLV